MTGVDDRAPSGDPPAPRAGDPETGDGPGTRAAGVAPDWVALLPPGTLGRVAVVGPLTAAARAALSVGRAVDDDGVVDTVVVTDDRRRALTRARAQLRPGGVLQVERSTRRRRIAVRRSLQRAGYQDVSTWWHRPSQEAARCLVQADRPVAAATVIKTVADRGRWTSVEVLLARTRLARALSAEVSLLAVAPGGEARGGALAQPDGDHPLDALVTPRFSTSRAVVGVTTTAGGRHLDRVAKVARRVDDDKLIAQEATNLGDLSRWAGSFPSAPPAARAVDRGGRTVLVEGAVSGLPLDRRAVRRDPAGALVSGRRWIEGLPVGAPTRPIDDGRAEELIGGPLRAIAGRPGRRAGARADLVARARTLLAPLEHASLPVVFEHGDLSHPNLLRDADGALTVVDWERARTHGLPLHDLTFFVAYLTESIMRPGSPDELADVVVRALRARGWARAELEVHAEQLGLDRSLLSLLQLACWTRRVAALPSTPATDDGAPHRSEVLWAATIADVEERRP